MDCKRVLAIAGETYQFRLWLSSAIVWQLGKMVTARPALRCPWWNGLLSIMMTTLQAAATPLTRMIGEPLAGHPSSASCGADGLHTQQGSAELLQTHSELSCNTGLMAGLCPG